MCKTKELDDVDEFSPVFGATRIFMSLLATTTTTTQRIATISFVMEENRLGWSIRFGH